MELSSYGMLKLAGIPEIIWPASLPSHQEEGSCARWHSWGMAEPDSAFDQPGPLPSPLRIERNVCGSWAAPPGLLPL